MTSTFKTYMETSTANDSSVDIATNFDIQVESFYAWNPSLNGDCTGLLVSSPC